MHESRVYTSGRTRGASIHTVPKLAMSPQAYAIGLLRANMQGMPEVVAFDCGDKLIAATTQLKNMSKIRCSDANRRSSGILFGLKSSLLPTLSLLETSSRFLVAVSRRGPLIYSQGMIISESYRNPEGAV
jgi:hypothetical protein